MAASLSTDVMAQVTGLNLPAHRKVSTAEDLSETSGLDVPEDVSLLGAVNALLRQRAVILVFALGCAGALIAFAFVRQRMHTSTSSFMPEARRTASNLSGIAAQFGLNIPGQEGSESPQFYVDLLRSPSILGAAVDTRYSFRSDTGPVSTTLIAVYHPRDASDILRRDAAIKRLDRALSTSVSAKTNVVTVSVSAPNPVLAREINARLIDLLNDFNLSRRQSGAREERRFAEQRVADVKEELRTTENRLQMFLESNREYRNSPALVFAQERLQSDVSFLRQLMTVLQQQAEQAKMEEVRDTPVITVIQPPDVPVRPDSRGVVKFGLLGLVLGAAIGIGTAFLREVLASSGVKQSTEFDEFTALRREAVSDLVHPWRALTRRRRSNAAPSARDEGVHS